MGVLLGAFLLAFYQAMDLSRPKRMMRPRAAARRMAHASVERRREVRVLGVDMEESPLEESATHTKKRVSYGC
jgi:hypothetical protein